MLRRQRSAVNAIRTKLTELLSLPAMVRPELHHLFGDAGLADFDGDPEVGDGGAAADGAGFGIKKGIGLGGAGPGHFGNVIGEGAAG